MPRILIVDDEKLKADLYAEIAADFDVITANSYDTAKFYLPQKFDHVLCDENLGDERGHKFIQEYSAVHPDADIFWYSASHIKPLANGYQCHDITKVADKLKSIKLKYKKEPEKAPKKCSHHEAVLIEIQDIKETVCAHDRQINEHSRALDDLRLVADKNIKIARWVFVAIGGSFTGIVGYFSWLLVYLNSAQGEKITSLATIIMAHINAK